MSERLAIQCCDERWAPIPSMPGYEASTLGRIRSVDRIAPHPRGPRRLRGTVLKLRALPNGYLITNTYRKTTLVSRAVLEAFVGPAPTAGMHACHRNGDRSDNRIENLRWDTPKGNEADKRQHGTDHRNERHPQARLTREQVMAIRADRRSEREIAAAFGISESHAGSVRRGVFWKL
jgi:hypothetical protein